MTTEYTGLTPLQWNVLDAVADMSIKRRGKNAGETKGVAPAENYDGRVLNALARRGLIEHKIDTVYGSGYVATRSGLDALCRQQADRTEAKAGRRPGPR